MKTDTAKRKAFLEQLKRVLPKCDAWLEWQEATGELPPDFDAMPSCAALPDPLAGVSVPGDWPARRDELKALFRKWVFGTVPPRPDNMAARVTSERVEGGVTLREVELTFGPDRAARLRLELLIPPGDGPFPVFLTQTTHRAWSLIALRRGYIACVYAGCDSHDDTDTFVPAWPECDWSKLMRRAWAAPRCIDYLETAPQADVAKIAVTGHSRNGKLSLLASAMDERIAAVISSSSGAGGSLATRLYSEEHFGEGVEAITKSFPDWFHPRWRFFAGREHKLPIDLHELVALSAPRPCLLSIAYHDMVEDARAMELGYRSARRVYELLGVPERLRILWRPGQHDTNACVIERYVDWTDAQFGRGGCAFPERFILTHDWDDWRAAARADMRTDKFLCHDLDDLQRWEGAGLPSERVRDSECWPRRRQVIRESVRWMLGEAPPEAENTSPRYGTERFYAQATCRRHEMFDKFEKHQVVAGEYFNVDVIAPAGTAAAGRKLPALLFLPPAGCSQGYVEGDTPRKPWWQIVPREGFVFVSFDPIGHGMRLEEAEGFYRRHPDWSLMGKMVRDVLSAVKAALTVPVIDPDHFYAFGYAMGAMTALHAMAFDETLSGLITLCPPAPFRTDIDAAETGGIARWAGRDMLMPRMGLFIGDERRVPYDVHQLMACVAPRPQLVISPTLDREAPVAEVTRAVESARAIYELFGASEAFTQVTPEDWNRFSEKSEEVILNWLRTQSA